MNKKDRHLIRIASIAFAFCAVILGAFGAHFLREILVARESTSIWETGVRYQMWHALALLFISVLQEKQNLSKTAGRCFIIGTIIFSGSLYLLALGAPRWLGPFTPIGGLLLIIGWFSLLVSTFKNYSE